MTEFNTPTEAEMNTFQEIFAKMQNALVAGSQLSKDFDALKVEVEGLRRDLQSLRNTNMALDDALTASRQRRDALEIEVADVCRERASKVQELEAVLHDRHVRIGELEHQLKLGNLRYADAFNALGQANKDRDDAQLRVMELEEELAKANEKLAGVTTAMDALQKALHPIIVAEAPKAEEPKPIAEPEPELVPQHEWETTEQYHVRVGRYPSEREARAAAQPRSDDGKFQSEPVAAKPVWDEGGWR